MSSKRGQRGLLRERERTGFHDSNWSKSVLYRRLVCRRSSPNCPAHFHVYSTGHAVGGPRYYYDISGRDKKILCRTTCLLIKKETSQQNQFKLTCYFRQKLEVYTSITRSLDIFLDTNIEAASPTSRRKCLPSAEGEQVSGLESLSSFDLKRLSPLLSRRACFPFINCKNQTGISLDVWEIKRTDVEH